MEDVLIREATRGDMSVVRDLYNALISTTSIAWTEEPQTQPDRDTWFEAQRRAGYPILVAEVAGEVVGFTAYSSFRGSGKWPGYRHTVEHTIHVDRRYWGRGVGRALLTTLIGRAAVAEVHVLVGAIDADNVESIRFHERLGFVEVARMPEVGRKFDRWLDLVLMQRIIEGHPPDGTSPERTG